MEIVDDSEVIKGDDIIGYRISKAREEFDSLEKDDIITITINRPPEPDTLSNILRGLKKEFSGKGVGRRCTEYILAELGYKTLYRYLSRSGFVKMKDVTEKVNETIGYRLVDGYPEIANFVPKQRDNTVHMHIHVSKQQHQQLDDLAHELRIPIGDVLLMCIICTFNDLNGRFDACAKPDLRYEKYCSPDGYLSVIMNNIGEIANKARLYIINSKNILEICIKEKEYVIDSGLQIPDNYKEKLDKERRLLKYMARSLFGNNENA